MSSLKWFKGNLHTHSTNSDGDTEPEHVAEWYHDHGYDFLVLSDHNHLTILDAPPAEQAKWPLLVRGEEITSAIGEKPLHVNGYGVERLVEPSTADSVVKVLQENVDRIREAGGMASINHPNFRWAFDDRELRQVDGYTFLEIFNGHPWTNDEGGGGRSSTVGIWDRLLSAGKQVWGIAVDDAHHFQGEFLFDRCNPGRGWVQVRTEDFTQPALLSAMDRGDFYASTGVTLSDLRMTQHEVVLEIEPEREALYTTVFTGRHGQLLDSADGLSPRYRPSRLDVYVRATVYSSRGTRAWTQPLFVQGG